MPIAYAYACEIKVTWTKESTRTREMKTENILDPTKQKLENLRASSEFFVFGEE